MVKINRY